MQFTEALTHLQSGHYVARHSWDKSLEYLVFMPGMQYIWKIQLQPNPAAGSWLPKVEDFLADDWKVITKLELPKKEGE